MYTYKVMLLLNNKQRTKVLNTMNKCIECYNIIVDYLDSFLDKGERIPSQSDTRKMFTKLKSEYDDKQKQETLNLTNKEKRESHKDVLFYDVSNDALKQTVKDCYNAYVRYFKKLADKPKKKRFNSKYKSFYVDPIKIEFTSNKVKLEKIANNQKENRRVLNWIKLAEKNRIPLNCSYYNPRVIFDGIRFWITVAVDDEYRPIKKKNNNKGNNKSIETIGIDMNINHIDLSNGDSFSTCNKDIKINKKQKQLKRMQRKTSKQYLEAKKNNKKLKDCKNFIKNKKQIRKIYDKIRNLSVDHNNKIINKIIELNPTTIRIENLDVKSMQKNKRLSSSLQITGIRKFINLLRDRIRYTTIEIKEIDKYYPSSKMCSCCGYIKKDLKLSERIYKCPCCGLVINRDLNAAINIKNFNC